MQVIRIVSIVILSIVLGNNLEANYVDLSSFQVQDLPAQNDPLVPFNPVINPDNGLPLYWHGKQRQGIVGWLDIPAHDEEQFDRVLTLKNAQGLISYIHPADPDVALPKGIFCWQSQWKYYAGKHVFSKTDKQCYDGLIDDYQGLLLIKQYRELSDFYLKQQPIGEFVKFVQEQDRGAWFWKDQKKLYKQSTHLHPSKDVDNYFQWAKSDKENKRLFRPLAFYAVMGVTEHYLREFFGADQKELFKPARFRDPDIVPMPSIEQMKKSFPIDSTYFSQRFMFLPIQVSSEGILLRTIKMLKQKAEKIMQKSAAKGNVKLLDGYQFYDQEIKQKKSPEEAQKHAQEVTDIRYLLAYSDFNNATFQIASNFGGLEGGIDLPVAMTIDMLWRPSQGEEASIATMGGSIYRKYYYPRVNMLQNLGNKVIMKNDKITQLLKPLADEDIPSIGLLVHNDIPVTSGYYKSYFLNPPDNVLLREQTKNEKYAGNFNVKYLATDEPSVKQQYVYTINNNFVIGWRNPINIFNGSAPLFGHEVHLALCAAIDLSHKQLTQELEESAKTILKAMYLGTLYAAVVNESEKVVLTLLGAGAFRNKIEWIADILNSDEVAQLIDKYGLKVSIINFPDFREGRKMSDEELTTLRNAVSGLQQKIDNFYKVKQTAAIKLLKKEEEEGKKESEITDESKEPDWIFENEGEEITEGSEKLVPVPTVFTPEYVASLEGKEPDWFFEGEEKKIEKPTTTTAEQPKKSLQPEEPWYQPIVSAVKAVWAWITSWF